MTGMEGFCPYETVVHVAAPAIQRRKSRRLARLRSVAASELAHLMPTDPLPSAVCRSI